MTTEVFATGGQTIERELPASEFAGLSDSQVALKLIEQNLAEFESTKESRLLKTAIGWLDVCDPIDREIAEKKIAKSGGITLAAIREQLKTTEPFPMGVPPAAKSKPPAAVSSNGIHLTELGNAQRFVAAFGADFRWVDPWLKWIAWDGKRWKVDAAREAAKAAATLPALLDRESADEEDPDRRSALRKWANRSETAHTVHAALDLAKPLLAALPDQFDHDGWLLNVNNGTLDLRTGELRPHDKCDLITRLAPVDYDPNATCQRWEQFLCEIFASHMPVIGYISRLAGLCLTADNTEHIFPMLWGAGRNGKSVFVDTFLGILGDYACKAPASLITIRHNEEHPTEIACLQGKRLVVGSETERGAQLRIQLIKEMTGDGSLKGRFMRGDYFDFPRTFKLFLMTNHKPRVHDDSVAAWERVQLIEFTVQFLEGTATPPDKNLSATLQAEWPGILAWAVKGNLARLANGGLGAPDSVKAATKEYRSEEDVLAGFIGETAVLDPGVWTPLEQLREAFQAASELKWGRIVTDRLKQLGCKSEARRYAGKLVRGWKGIRLASASQEDPV